MMIEKDSDKNFKAKIKWDWLALADKRGCVTVWAGFSPGREAEKPAHLGIMKKVLDYKVYFVLVRQ